MKQEEDKKRYNQKHFQDSSSRKVKTSNKMKEKNEKNDSEILLVNKILVVTVRLNALCFAASVCMLYFLYPCQALLRIKKNKRVIMSTTWSEINDNCQNFKDVLLDTCQ